MPGTTRSVLGGDSLIRIPVADKLEADIKTAVEEKMRSRLGIKPSEGLPPEVTALARSAAETAAAKATELAVIQEAEEAARATVRGDVLKRFDTKVDLAARGMEHISKSSDVEDILKRRAELLARKKQALVDAGFTNDEAMQIVLADIAARAH